MAKLLVLGKTGQVGEALVGLLGECGEVIACGRDDIDLTDPDSIRQKIRQIRPDVIINAAAYTFVDQAEQEPDLAYAINAHAPGILAKEAKDAGALLIHYSTDYVFDGKGTTPYQEDDTPNPLNVYGHSKWEGEKAIQAVGGSYIIFRTSWVYGCLGSNFLLTMLRLAKEKTNLRIVADQVGAPTWSHAIAQMTVKVLMPLMDKLDNPDLLEPYMGIFNLTAAGQVSWHGFAEAIFSYTKKNGKRVPELEPITTAEYPQAATRPQFSVLANTRFQDTFGLQMPGWQSSLDECLEQIK